MRKITQVLTLSLTVTFIFVTYCIESANEKEIKETIITEKIINPISTITIYKPLKPVVSDNLLEESTGEEKDQVSNEDIELIALVTMAEAEGECEKGKRLVIDTILNRVDSEHFPDTIHKVVYQPHQFTSMWNGRVARCEVREDIFQLVKEELESRTNYDVVFFTAGKYSKYGVPMFQVEHHYFSSYD